MRLYRPFTRLGFNLPPRIVYIARDEKAPVEAIISRNVKCGIEAHIEKLYWAHPELATGDFHILFLWNHHGMLMTDVWIMRVADPICPDSGALGEIHIFAGFEISTGTGHASDDTFAALYGEALLRRKLGLPIAEYVNRGLYLPEIPPEFMTQEPFTIRT